MIVEENNPVRILHGVAGFPHVKKFEARDFVCRICDLPASRGRSFASWLPITATDWELWHGPDGYVCEACAWVRSGRPGSAECLRMESHIWSSEIGWMRIPKNEVARLRTTILVVLNLLSPWFAAVAVSGKKHILPRARLNTGGLNPAVAFETEVADLKLVGGRWIALDIVEDVRNLGFSAKSISSGQYSAQELRRVDAGDFLSLERRLRVLRGRSELNLAIHLTKRVVR